MCGNIDKPARTQYVVCCVKNIIIDGGSTALYESFATVGEIRVWWRADFQSGSRMLKKVF